MGPTCAKAYEGAPAPRPNYAVRTGGEGALLKAETTLLERRSPAGHGDAEHGRATCLHVPDSQLSCAEQLLRADTARMAAWRKTPVGGPGRP